MADHQSVASFNLPDGDCVYLYWDPNTRKYNMMSVLDPATEECTLRDVRRTIYWAMGEDPYTTSQPITISNMVRRHRELLQDGEPWMELCSQEQCASFLDDHWDGYSANRIYITFDVF